jgi:hypothetical protein
VGASGPARRRPAYLALSALLLLAACGTPRDLPTIRYLDAEHRGSAPRRVSEEQFRREAALWRDAVVDARACGLPSQQVLTAGFAARSELTAMRDHADGNTDGVIASLLTDVVMSALPGRLRPEASRCRRLAAWLPTVQARREEVGDWSALERLLGGSRIP